MDCTEGKSNGGESYVITVYFNPWNVAVLSSKEKGEEKEEGSVVENNFKMGKEAWTLGLVTNVSIEIEGGERGWVGSITRERLMSDNSTDWPEFAWIRADNFSRHLLRSRPFSTFDKWKLISYRWLPLIGDNAYRWLMIHRSLVTLPRDIILPLIETALQFLAQIYIYISCVVLFRSSGIDRVWRTFDEWNERSWSNYVFFFVTNERWFSRF